MQLDPLTIVLYSIVGGLLPTLFWLWFWRREDEVHPEPRSLISIAFFAGMVCVGLALPFQYFSQKAFGEYSLYTLTAWAATEEILKYGAAYFFAIRKKFCDEPIDPMIYLIATALGFAALENAFFISQPLIEGATWDAGLEVTILRLVGANLLHILSSAVIGIFIALPFFKKGSVRIFSHTVGVFFAIALHTAFNLFIIQDTTSATAIAFSIVWVGIVGILIVFEQVKRITT